MIVESKDYEEMAEFFRLWNTLNDDVENLEAQLKTLDSQATRRAYVRSVLAHLEGVVFGLKQQALTRAVETLPDAERALLAEEAYDIDSKGNVVSKASFIRLEANIRFAFSAFGRSQGAVYTMPVGEHEWASVLKSIHVRNRITHPKHHNDLTISDDELKAVRLAFEWFGKKHRQVVKVVTEASFKRSGMTEAQIRRAIESAPFSFD